VTTLAELSGRSPDDVAVECGDVHLTWAELDDRANAVANGLERSGATSGSHVAICVSNRAEFVEVVLGAWRAGCAYTPLKTGWTADEIGYVFGDAQTRLVVTDRDGARAAAHNSDVAVIDLDDRYDEWLLRQDRSEPPADRCGYKMPYTSGTTGRPKGVVMTGAGTVPFAAGWAGLQRWAEALSLPGDGVHLFGSRLFNGAPQTFGFGALARGATLRIMPRWSAADGLRELGRDDVTGTIMVPTMFRQLLALPDVDRSRPPAPSLRTLLHGGEPCPPPIKEAIADWFGDVLVEYYGFTEGGFTIVGRDEWRAHPGSVGRSMPGMHVEIRDEHGAAVPAGVDGTVFFRSDAGRRFRYSGDDSKTEAAHAGDAFSVGDVGHVDADGYLYLSGRSADIVITAGVNVYPAEIESALSDVDGVLDMCAVGTPDDERGEVVALYVVPAPGHAETQVLERINAAAAERLAPYKRPRVVRVIDEVPRDETGKLLRRVLRDSRPSRE
jgi:long-chain acyl-CoA synthetase